MSWKSREVMAGESCVVGLVLCDDNPLRDRLDETIIEAYGNGDYVVTHRRSRFLAEQGDASAQVFLGALFQDGWGTARDYNEAVRWYRSASELGHPVAQLLLANRYQFGEGGLRKDYDKAWELFYKAADQNYATAYYALAAMSYLSSRENYIEAYKWAMLAAARLKQSGHKDFMVSMIESLESDLSSEEIAEAERMISEWKPKKDLSLHVE
jgi:hypothetical protein